ncbi:MULTISPECIES: AI-2E family transporter [Alteromonadaceae]|uniref:AI-2E family transporter n=1 Tax=Alteromonadaceae TaxID=72275 RepID=UPI001C085E8A|nr:MULTISPECIES: AI-2E family transporter [Aliiglaciecola]MBU2877145.1 AI-2E family transporter [Aliiglaciecola lipolytica]MDO6712075.1 AI-2E family transporter [Aliiglaciecola sp. 2_MG-2023]MDO6753155.1 AI-2E family transporter [Aliiglaciecola sp. 1_MG-2023]
MFEMLDRWYKRKFSDPDSLMLLMLLIFVSVLFAIWGDILMPVIVAAVIAYLLDWPLMQLMKLGLSRVYATVIIVLVFIAVCILTFIGLVPVITQQSVNLIKETPQIWNKGQEWLLTLPDLYPNFIQIYHIQNVLQEINQKIVQVGETLISASFSSLADLGAILIYLILVPLMLFFMLKDKDVLIANLLRILPNERRLIKQVSSEMNLQIANYIRGKVIEIIIVGAVSSVTFAFMDLRYAVLLGVLVGFSVLIPYIGAAVVTLPIAIVALFQWGITPDFWYLMIAYGIIQALDGNVLVPILFSEAVSLHPIYIIVAVLFFGGLWGFWGVFFAIPLATLVKAVINAWSPSVTYTPESGT